jgi:hypothetical protein
MLKTWEEIQLFTASTGLELKGVLDMLHSSKNEHSLPQRGDAVVVSDVHTSGALVV